LIKRGDKALLGGHLRVHFVTGHFLFLGRLLTREVFGQKSPGGDNSSAEAGALLLKRSVSFVALGDSEHQFHRLLLESNVIGQLLPMDDLLNLAVEAHGAESPGAS
jgi:hypothetical protein